MTKKKEEEDVLKVFKREKILTLNQLADLLSYCQRTVQRRLKQWSAYTSYNKNGRYYVLPIVVRFDEKGLWKYKGVFFSKNGNLKETVNALIHNSTAGLTVKEAGKLLGVPLGSFLSQQRNVQQIRKEKIAGPFVYFSSDEGTFIKQKQKRQQDDTHLRLTKLPTDTEAVIILVERIKHPALSIEELSVRLNKKGHRIKVETIGNLFERHGLEKKTMDTGR